VNRTRFRTIAVAAAVGTVVTIGAVPAYADPSDCAYPSVCLYQWTGDGYRKTGQFQQFTASWQNLTISRGAMHLVNTRHDDVVYVLHEDGVVSCFPPDQMVNETAPIVAIRIDPSPVCRV
jgi:hypothetical protein